MYYFQVNFFMSITTIFRMDQIDVALFAQNMSESLAKPCAHHHRETTQRSLSRKKHCVLATEGTRIIILIDISSMIQHIYQCHKEEPSIKQGHEQSGPMGFRFYCGCVMQEKVQSQRSSTSSSSSTTTI